MFTTLGTFAARRHRVILIFTALFIAAGFALGVGVFGNLKSGGFDNPSSESSRARAVLVNEFNAADANVVLLITANSGSVDDPAVAAAGTALTAQLSTHPGVSHVAGYWTLGNAPPLRSKDGTKAIVVARIDGIDAGADTTFHELKTSFEGDRGPITVGFGGEAAINADLGDTIKADLGRAEGLAIPLTIVLLILVFGGLVAASLPLFVAIIAVPGTLLSLLVISQVTDVSIYSINLTTALGLGLAIDYSLFIVNRFREELDNGLSVEAAVIRTVETAGRTVAFSALTVAGSLVALLAFPLYFLRSFAYAGTSVVLIAAVGALVSLPALLSVVGLRINSLRVFRRRSTRATSGGFWHRLASLVMKRPVPIAAAVIGVLILLGLPFFRASFGLPGYETLPESSKARTVSAQLLHDFEGNTAGSFAAVVTGVDPTTVLPQLDAYAAQVSGLPGVARVSGLTGTYVQGVKVALDPASASYQRPSGTWLTVTPSINPESAEGEQLVKAIRSIPTTLQVGVEGQAAQLVDTKSAIGDRLPIALGIIAAITFVLLFLVFGSLLVPIKAIVLNLLSLTATFGAMVWIFQDGHLSGPLGFTATGRLDISMPILMFCIAFGLSMDYEVFLLSRIKEEHDLTGDNRHSVAMGLERTGRIVTAAAALLAVTFLAFGTSGVSFIKMFGIGLTLAIVMDATVIRGLLVPAFMRLAGEANWWAPRWMQRIHNRFGISESARPAASIPRVPVDSLAHRSEPEKVGADSGGSR
jgi:putative drug exporter of the RND superfamily